MKKTILTILQIAVTLGVLWWVFRDPGKRADMLAALRSANPLWIAAGFGAFAAVVAAATARWALLLRVQGVVLPLPRLFALVLVGLFFNLFLPGATAGDVVKIFYLLKETPGKKTAALLATLMDRVIGLLALMLIAAAMVAWRHEFLMATETTRNLTWSLLAILVASFGGIGFSFLLTGLNLVDKLPAKFPGRTIFADLSVAYHAYARHWGASLGGIGISFLVHAGSFLVFYFGALALRAPASLGDVFAIVPIINTISAMPFSVGGAGVREWLSQELFSKLCNIPEASAVAISLIVFVVLAIWAVIGGIAYLLYRPSEHARLKQMSNEVTSLEKEVADGPPPA